MGTRDAAADGLSARLRRLPSVERLAAALDAPHPLAVAAAREAIEEARAAILESGETAPAAPGADGALPGGSADRGERPPPADRLAPGDRDPDLLALAREWLGAAEESSLVRVINATGVIVHTNLGRAPLAAAAREAVARVAEGYANLELDLATGERGSRQDHLEALLCELTGARAALVVRARGRPARPRLELPHARLRRGGGGRGAVLSRGAGDRRRGLGQPRRGAGRGRRRAAGASLGHGRGGARVLLGGQAARGPAGGDPRRSRRGDRLRAGPPARPRAAGRQALARRAGATLRLYRDPARARAEVPVLAMLDAPEAQLAARAAALNGRLAAAGVVSEVVRRTAKVGGARSRRSSWRARWSRWIPASWQPASSRGGSGSRPSVTSRDGHPSSPASSASGCCSIPGR